MTRGGTFPVGHAHRERWFAAMPFAVAIGGSASRCRWAATRPCSGAVMTVHSCSGGTMASGDGPFRPPRLVASPLNVVALGLLASLFEDVLRAFDWCVALGVSLDSNRCGISFLSPQVDWYVGLSGVLHGRHGSGALRAGRDERAGRLPFGVAVVAKVVWEQLSGPSAFSLAASGGPVVVDAHLYGLLGGVMAAAVLWVLQRRDERPL